MKKILYYIIISFTGVSGGFAQSKDISSDTTVVEKEATINEVVVKAFKRIEKGDAKKSVFKLNAKLPENIKADMALQELPGITSDNEGFRIAGNDRVSKLLIDGIEATQDEIRALKASDIDRVEVKHVSTEGNKYAGEINVIRKKRHDTMLYGSLGVSGSMIRRMESVTPNISYRNDRFEVSFLGGLTRHESNLNTSMDRWLADGEHQAFKSDGNSTVWQRLALLKSSYLFSDKLSMFLSYGYFNYDIKQRNDIISISGMSGKNDLHEKVDNHITNAMLKYAINNNNRLFLKGRFQFYRDKNKTEQQAFDDYSSMMREYSIEVLQEIDSLRLFRNWHEVNYGLKAILRGNQTSGAETLHNDVYVAYLNDRFNLSKRWSLYWQLNMEWAQYRAHDMKKNEYSLLPSVRLNYRKGKSSLSLTAERYVTRPSVDYLNPDVFYINEVSQIIGNPDLNAQYNNWFNLSFQQQIKSAMLTLSSSYQYLSDDIELVYNEDMNSATYMNAGYGNILGFTVSYMQPFLKNRLTINTSFETKYYDFRIANSLRGMVQSMGNAGWGYRASLYASYISTKQWYYMVTGSVNTYIREMSSVTTQLPMLSFTIQKSFLKNKLTVSLSGMQLLNTRIKKEFLFRTASETMTNKTYDSNISLSLTWNFGKVFMPRRVGDTISNNDIQVKQQ